MQAFISYSINDNDQAIVTLLSSKLKEKNFIVRTSQNFYSRTLDFNTVNEIGSSHLFVGVITGRGNQTNRVLEEWNYAHKRNIPALLLIEDTVGVDQNFTGNYIRFNRFSPQKAIDEINRRMHPPANKTSSSDDILPWVLGGAALLAMIALLSSDKK